jgi:hypothetical protein
VIQAVGELAADPTRHPFPLEDKLIERSEYIGTAIAIYAAAL